MAVSALGSPIGAIGASTGSSIQPLGSPVTPSASLPDAKTPFQSPLQNIASGNSQDNVDLAKGGIKGMVSSLASVGAQNAGPVGADMLAHAPALAADLNGLNSHLKPSNLPQAVGMANERLGESVLPVDAAVSGISKGLAATTDTLKASAISDINKGLGNTGKTSATGLLSKDSNRLQGMETLYNVTKDQPITRPDGSTFNFDPKNISDPHDLVSAFVQAKSQLWSKVQTGLEKGSSIVPNYSPVESQLQDVIDNSASKSLVAHAQARLSEIQTLKTQGVQGAQRYLQEELNPRIGAAVSGATDAPALKLDATVANGVNNALDSGLAQVKDASVRPYKDMYASLKSIEPDLVKMAQKVLRAPGGGIPQYINDFGNLDLLDAVLTHNPALFVARGIGKKVLASVLQSQRNPLDHLSSAFQSIAKYSGDAAPLTDAPTLALPPGVPGAGSRVSPGYKISLPARTQSTVDAQEAARLQSQLPSGNQ